jgi:hypothetical protein
MTTTHESEIKVIYSASARGQRQHQRRPRAKVGTPRSGSRIGAVLLGLITLAVGAGILYGTWWRVDPFIGPILVMKTPLPWSQEDANALAARFGVRQTKPARRPPTEPRPDSSQETVGPRFVGATAQWLIPGTAYGWLTLTTAGACLLTLASGAMWAPRRGVTARRILAILTVGGALFLAWLGYDTWSEYGRSYPVAWLRHGMAGLGLLAFLLGLSVGRGGRWIARVSAIVLILSGAGTATALYLGYLCDAIEPEQATAAFLAMAFVVHSLWGFVLLPLSWVLPCGER